MKILIVTNPEAGNPIHRYAAKCTDDMLFDVETAFEELEIKVSEEIVEEIAQQLLHNRNYWYNETYCFEVICVPEI